LSWQSAAAAVAEETQMAVRVVAEAAALRFRGALILHSSPDHPFTFPLELEALAQQLLERLETMEGIRGSIGTPALTQQPTQRRRQTQLGSWQKLGSAGLQHLTRSAVQPLQASEQTYLAEAMVVRMAAQIWAAEAEDRAQRLNQMDQQAAFMVLLFQEPGQAAAAVAASIK
jgi:hypothetical protein